MATYIIGSIVIALFIFAAYKMFKDAKDNPGCPGCAGCSKKNCQRRK